MSAFEKQRERGKVYELAFATWLQLQRDYYVLPTYDYSGLANNKPPKLISKVKGLVIPDLLAYKEGDGAWFEIKLKTEAVLHRKTQTIVTGLPYRHWLDYQQVHTVTGLPIWIVFIHENEQIVKTCDINKAPISHIFEGDKMDRGGTIFFAFEKLITLISLPRLDKFVRREG